MVDYLIRSVLDMSDDWVFFWSDKETCRGKWRANVFSNWYGCHFTDPMTGLTFANSEQYMMAGKVCHPFAGERSHCFPFNWSIRQHSQFLGAIVQGFRYP